MGQDGDTSFSGFHRGLDSRGASVCFGAGPTSFSLLSHASPPFPPYTLFFRQPSAYSFVFILFSSLVLPSPLSGPLCVFSLLHPLSSLFRTLVNSPP